MISTLENCTKSQWRYTGKRNSADARGGSFEHCRAPRVPRIYPTTLLKTVKTQPPPRTTQNKTQRNATTDTRDGSFDCERGHCRASRVLVMRVLYESLFQASEIYVKENDEVCHNNDNTKYDTTASYPSQARCALESASFHKIAFQLHQRRSASNHSCALR